jgi:hypothetical protein
MTAKAAKAVATVIPTIFSHFRQPYFCFFFVLFRLLVLPYFEFFNRNSLKL